jgi:hypothetical protein
MLAMIYRKLGNYLFSPALYFLMILSSFMVIDIEPRIRPVALSLFFLLPSIKKINGQTLPHDWQPGAQRLASQCLVCQIARRRGQHSASAFTAASPTASIPDWNTSRLSNPKRGLIHHRGEWWLTARQMAHPNTCDVILAPSPSLFNGWSGSSETLKRLHFQSRAWLGRQGFRANHQRKSMPGERRAVLWSSARGFRSFRKKKARGFRWIEITLNLGKRWFLMGAREISRVLDQVRSAAPQRDYRAPPASLAVELERPAHADLDESST